MRWKLLRRGLSIGSARVSVRNHVPWPLRWAVLVLAFGLAVALAMWALGVGRGAAPHGGSEDELHALRQEVATLRSEIEKARSIANTSESLLKMERVLQAKLAQQLRAAETENLALKGDLGFFERLLPAAVGSDRLAIRGLHVEPLTAGRLRFHLLVMQSGKAPGEFNGRYDVTLMGMLEGKPWTLPAAGGAKALQLKQYLRVDGVLDHPAQAVVKSVQVRVTDSRGAVRATQAVEL